MELLRIVFLLVSAAALVWLVRRAVRRAHQLSDRIEEYHREQEENPQDPYTALAELMEEQRREGRK